MPIDLKGIISISGKPGLSKIVTQSRGGLIAESLADGKRFAVHGSEKISSLEDISIFTQEEDLLLTEVFEMILKAHEGKKVLSHKSKAEELKSFLKEILPNYDENRVYNSDIKKLVQWYNILIEQKIIQLKDIETEKKKSTSEKKATEEKTEDKTKKVQKASAKKKNKTAPPASGKKQNSAKPKSAPSRKNISKPSSKGK